MEFTSKEIIRSRVDGVRSQEAKMRQHKKRVHAATVENGSEILP